MWSREFAWLCCFPSPNLKKSLVNQSLIPTTTSRPPDPSPPFSSSSSCCYNRRALTVSILVNHLPLAAAFFLGPSPPSVAASTSHAEELERYTDDREGFTLLRPSSWAKVEKAGATALFEDPTAKVNSVGVVVNPVRISSLSDFGTPRDIADKLIQAERRKESTKEAEVIQVRERTTKGGFPVYEFEYRVDSTRGGVKRIFSAAFVASKKLYLLNISHSDAEDNPLDPLTKVLLEQLAICEKLLGKFTFDGRSLASSSKRLTCQLQKQ